MSFVPPLVPAFGSEVNNFLNGFNSYSTIKQIRKAEKGVSVTTVVAQGSYKGDPLQSIVYLGFFNKNLGEGHLQVSNDCTRNPFTGSFIPNYNYNGATFEFAARSYDFFTFPYAYSPVYSLTSKWSQDKLNTSAGLLVNPAKGQKLDFQASIGAEGLSIGGSSTVDVTNGSLSYGDEEINFGIKYQTNLLTAVAVSEPRTKLDKVNFGFLYRLFPWSNNDGSNTSNSGFFSLGALLKLDLTNPQTPQGTVGLDYKVDNDTSLGFKLESQPGSDNKTLTLRALSSAESAHTGHFLVGLTAKTIVSNKLSESFKPDNTQLSLSLTFGDL